jgi:cation transporter-like permease
MGRTLRALAARLTTTLHQRAENLRREPDRGSHSVEYAIGIGLGAVIILAVYGAYKTGVATVVSGWVFK